MKYKDDWPEAKKRLEAWWRREVIDRVCIRVTATKGKMSHFSVYDIHRYPPEEFLSRYEETISRTYFGGEAVPMFHIETIPCGLRSLFGCKIHYSKEENTVWGKPIPIDWEKKVSDIFSFNPQKKEWQFIKDLTALAIERAKGNCLVGITDYSPIDSLYLLRGNEEFLIDLKVRPGKVKEALTHLLKITFRVHQELHDIIQNGGQDGSISWLDIWSSGKNVVMQVDMAGMVSTKMFREIFAPILREQAAWLDHSIYHLDSPENSIQHLDTLLDIPEIDAIQWNTIPGTSIWQWIPELKKVQKAGKGLVLTNGIKKEDIEPLLSELSPEGLLFSVTCNSQEEAEELLNNAKRWTGRNR